MSKGRWWLHYWCMVFAIRPIPFFFLLLWLILSDYCAVPCTM
jgi:hypothetical protein